MRKFVLSIILLLAITAQGAAQTSTKKEKIKALFALMHQDSLMIKTIDAMTASMVKSMSRMFTDTAYTNLGIDVSKMTQKLVEKSMQKSKENALKLLNGERLTSMPTTLQRKKLRTSPGFTNLHPDKKC